MIDLLIALDHQIFLLVNGGLSCKPLDTFFVFFTNGNFLLSAVAATIALILMTAKDKKRVLLLALLTIVAVGLSDLAAYRIFKPLIHRLRPCNPAWFTAAGEHLFLVGAHFLEGYKTSFSCPSNHATNAFAFASLWFAAYPRMRTALGVFTFATLVAVSRVYTGVHYPFDVFFGAVLGSGIGIIVWFGYMQIRRRFWKGGGVAVPAVNTQIAD